MNETENSGAERAAIQALDAELFARFADRVRVAPFLSRQVVSFQNSKERPLYRWFKYKEAFSPALVELLLREYSGSAPGVLLDPFAGSGAALFAAGAHGWEAHGIELLPIGQEIIQTRRLLQDGFDTADAERIRFWRDTAPWLGAAEREPIPTLRITAGAYPPDTEAGIERYCAAMLRENPAVRRVLRFALLCVLEGVSYTRKDGQYLRWDARSGRKQGARPFNKGAILPFEQAVSEKLGEIMQDCSLDSFAPLTLADGLFGKAEVASPPMQLLAGSCLDILPSLTSETYDAIITSPPYCNRYDYTRTYALELALLGVGTEELVRLRQTLLSCTVENKPKPLPPTRTAQVATSVADKEPLLQAILAYLENEKRRKLLNNEGIPRMVRGYFYEMAQVIAEGSRVLKRGGLFAVVNDNVRYQGVPVSVDLILSSFAESLGLHTEAILTLPIGKGNSSQQMGEHGREALRKCVYIWRKS